MLEIEKCDSTMFTLRTDDVSRRQTKSLSIKRQRSFHIVHPDSHHGDAWFHFIFTVTPTRMNDKKVEISTYAQHACLVTRIDCNTTN